MVLLVYPIGLLVGGIAIFAIIESRQSEKQKLIEENETYLEKQKDQIEKMKKRKKKFRTAFK